MISLDIIDKDILELETNHDTTWATVERLSWLYTVRDHIHSSQNMVTLTDTMSGSDFLTLSSNVNTTELLKILDEHMDVIKVTYPKEYDALLNKIKSLHDTH